VLEYIRMTGSYSNDEHPIDDNPDETVFIFGQDLEVGSMTRSNKKSFLKKMVNVADSSTPPSSKVYKNFGSISVYRRNKEFRAFCSIAELCPRYNVVYIHKITEDHNYNFGHLQPNANSLNAKFNKCSSVDEIEKTLEEYNCRTSSDIEDMY